MHEDFGVGGRGDGDGRSPVRRSGSERDRRRCGRQGGRRARGGGGESFRHALARRLLSIVAAEFLVVSLEELDRKSTRLNSSH